MAFQYCLSGWSGLLVLAFWYFFWKKCFVKIICKNRIIWWQSHNKIVQAILIINNMYNIMLLQYYWYWDKIKALYILTSSDMCGCAWLTLSVKVLRTSSHPSLIIPSDNMRVTILYSCICQWYSYLWSGYSTDNWHIELKMTSYNYKQFSTLLTTWLHQVTMITM